MTRSCSNCGATLQNGETICPTCAASSTAIQASSSPQTTCPTCKATLTEHARFCRQCGEPITIDTELAASDDLSLARVETFIKRKNQRNAWVRPLAALRRTLSAMFHRGVLVATLSVFLLLIVGIFVIAIAYALWPLTIAVLVFYGVVLAFLARRYSNLYVQLDTQESINWLARQAVSGTPTARNLASKALVILGPHAVSVMERLRREASAKVSKPEPSGEKVTPEAPKWPEAPRAPDVDALIGALDDPQEKVRHEAFLALTQVRDPRAVVPITTLLVDTDGRIRVEAAQFLGESGDQRAVEPLIQTLDQHDNELKAAAARALGIIGDERARDPLRQLRNSTTDPRVQGAANEALVQLGEQPAPPAPFDIEAWMPSLPFPLASILWAYHADQDAREKLGHLLGFFEGMSIFVPTLTLSAMVNDQNAWQELDQRFGATLRSKPLGNFSAPSFRNWVVLGERLADALRTLREESAWDTYNKLFGGLDDGLVELLTNKKLYSMLHAVVNFRNKHAHGGTEGDEEVQRDLDELKEWLPKAYELIADRFATFRIVSPVSSTLSGGIHHYKVKNLVGPYTLFKEDSAETVRTMDSDLLYVLHRNSTMPIELLPLFKIVRFQATKQDVCYFYNRLEKRDTFRWVSFYYEQGSEIYEPDERASNALTILTASPVQQQQKS